MSSDYSPYRQVMPRGDIETLIRYLADKYPATFFTQPQLKRPLKKNIIADLERTNVLDDARREAAISFYTRDWNYEYVLQAGAERIDLNGQKVGTVTEQEALEATKRVRAQKQERRERLAKDAIETTRSLHAAGKISTDQLSKITAPKITTPKGGTMKPETKANALARMQVLLDNATRLMETEDAGLRSALVAAALKVLVAETTTVIAEMDEG
jgi:sRNA-binding protein